MQLICSETAQLEALLFAHQLSHRRALYFQRTMCARRRVKAAIAACAKVERTASLKAASRARLAIEVALDAIAPAWLQLRHLLSQTFFMGLALSLLAHLARLASLLVQEHKALRTKLRQGGAITGPSEDRSCTPPILLGLDPTAGEPQGALSRVFAASVTRLGGDAKLHSQCSSGSWAASHGAAAPAAAPTEATPAGRRSDATLDLGLVNDAQPGGPAAARELPSECTSGCAGSTSGAVPQEEDVGEAVNIVAIILYEY